MHYYELLARVHGRGTHVDEDEDVGPLVLQDRLVNVEGFEVADQLELLYQGSAFIPLVEGDVPIAVGSCGKSRGHA